VTSPVRVDVPADLNAVDETGFVWTFLDEARSPELVTPGAIVTTGEEDEPAVAEVVDLVEKGAGTVVHLRILPGTIEDYAALVARTVESPG
jgi:hypothetical protein